MSAAILKTLRTFVDLKAQYEALVLEQAVISAQGITPATTAQLEALDLAFIRWDAVYRSAVRTLEGLCKGATPRGSQDWLAQQ